MRFCILISIILSAFSVVAEASRCESIEESLKLINDGSFSALHPISSQTFENLRNIDPAIVQPDTLREDILECPISEFRRLVEFAINCRGGSMHYFAHPYFYQSQKIHYWSKDSLNIGNSEYYVGTMFPPTGRTRRDYFDGKRTIPKDTFFMYEGVLVGHGRVVIIYPHHASVHRDDYPFDFMTGNYELYRVNILDNQSEYYGITELTHFRGRDYPDQKLKPVIGTLGVPLTKVSLARWRDDTGKIYANFVGFDFPHPLFFRYRTPIYDMPPERTRIPPDINKATKHLASEGSKESRNLVLK